jgi:anti-sigma regulatory factor (Ser/Thr protein kinase)
VADISGREGPSAYAAAIATHRLQHFAGDSSSPAAARGFARQVLAEPPAATSPDLHDDVELVVSELVTNAVRAGATSITVEVELEAGRVLIRVRDDARGWPAARDADLLDPGGRGLPLVGAVSANWGVHEAPAAGGGKVVWAELGPKDSAPDAQ